MTVVTRLTPRPAGRGRTTGASGLGRVVSMRRWMLVHLGGASLLVAVASVGVPISADAASENARLGLTPIGQPGLYFDLTMVAGQAQQLSVEVGNFCHADVLARTYPSDVYSIVNGGFGAALFGAQPSGTSRWLDYRTQELTLKPGSAVRIDFRVRVPNGTPPGQYVTSLVAESLQPAPAGGSSVAIN